MPASIPPFAFLVVLFLLTSCGSPSKSVSHEETGNVPIILLPRDLTAKFQERYPTSVYLIGIGQAASEKAASELARADLVKQMRLEVNVIWSDFLREHGGTTEQEVSRLVETRAAELITGMVIVDQGRDDSTGLRYAVAVVPKSEIARRLHGSFDQSDTASRPLDAPQTDESIWVVAEGIASLGDEATVPQAKARSRDEARRKATEQAVGTFVKGHTVVYNAQVADDLVHSLVRGIVIEEQVLDEGIREIGGKSGLKAVQYATTLKARIKPLRPERRSAFAVKAALNKTVFSEGEEMQIRATITQDAYLHIFNVGQDDAVTVLLPNRFANSNLVHANRELVFPDEAQRSLGIRLRVFPPAGVPKALEKMKLVATTKPIDFMKGKIKEGVYQVYEGKETALITDLLRELSHLDESEWVEITVPYEVRR